MIRRFYFLIAVLTLLCRSGQAQSAYFANYKPLTVKGNLPAYFLESSTERYKKQAQTVAKSQSRAARKAEDRFYELNGYFSENARFSGKVLIDDTVTNYLETILDNLLRDAPNLRDRISIYAMRSSVVNAFATPDGMIFVNLGLIGRMDNEDELAFVIAHEISHIYKKHSLNSYLGRFELDVNARVEGSEDQSWEIHNYSQYSELQADSLGFDLFKRCGYHEKAAYTVLEKLKLADYPFTNKKIDVLRWQSQYAKIPQYFSDKEYCEPVPDENDEAEGTHPAIEARKALIAGLLTNPADTSALVDPGFIFYRTVARFECASLYNNEGEFFTGIYHTSMLLDEFPGNIYLNQELARSFYGAVLVRDRQESIKDLRNKIKAEETKSEKKDRKKQEKREKCGEARRVRDLFLEQNKEAAATMALRVVWGIHQNFPADKDIQYYTFGIMTELSKNNCKIDNLTHTREEYFRTIGASDSMLSYKIDSLEIEWAGANRSSETKNIYRFGFIGVQDSLFKFLYGKAKQVSWGDDAALMSLTEYLVGAPPATKGIVAVDPFTFYANISRKSDESINFTMMQRIRTDIIETIEGSAENLDVPVTIMSPALTKQASADQYNSLIWVNEWIECSLPIGDSAVFVVPYPITKTAMIEQHIHGSKLVSTGYLQLQKGREFDGYQVLGTIGGIAVPNLIWTVNKPHFAAVFYYDVFDLRTGKAVYAYEAEMSYQVYRRSMVSTHIYHAMRESVKK